MKNNSILLVDDSKANLDHLYRALRDQYKVTVCSAGEEAVNLVESQPADYEFVVIDQLLGAGIDGIETAKRIADISEDVFILVFSNVAATSLEDLEKDRYAAFEAGAHRYLERKTDADPRITVEQFIEEMSQLARLRDRLKMYYDERRTVPSLVTQLDLGVDVVDRAYKVWLMNKAMRRISGHSPGLPRNRCSHWHGYRLCPCPGCLVNETFRTGETRDRMFLTPVRGGELAYMHVWTQPVIDEQGKALVAGDGLPLAVMETVHELSGPALAQSIPYDKRISVIAGAIYERLRDGYVRIQPFKKVAVYSVNPSEEAGAKLALRAIAGYSSGHNQTIGAPFDPAVVPEYEAVLTEAMNDGVGVFSDQGHTHDPIDDTALRQWIDWLILGNDDTPLAFLRVSGSELTADDVDLLHPYAKEIARAVVEHRASNHTEVTGEAQRALIAIDNLLQTVASPEGALQALVEEACLFTESYLGHLRERRGNRARLVRVTARGYDGYERVAQGDWPITHRASWAARTILSGAEQHRPRISDDVSEIADQRCGLSKEMRIVLKEAKSFCFEPLVFNDMCIGALGFHSKMSENYSEGKLWYLRQIAQRAAFALHDLQMKREAEERLENVRADVVQLLLHNINNPLGAIMNWIGALRGELREASIQREQALKVLDRLSNDCKRIGKIREEFAALFQPLDVRRKLTPLHEVIEGCVQDLVPATSSIKSNLDLCERLSLVVIDAFVVRTCLEVLMQNAVDAIDSQGIASEKTVRICLRVATRDEAAHLSSQHRCLAVEVVDSGPGISDAKREKLFRIIKTEKPQGMGIGLARCRRFARLSGGDVYYDITNEPGAKFVLVMPFEPNSEK